MTFKIIYSEFPGSGLGDILLGFISSYWLSKILDCEIYSNNEHIFNIFEIEKSNIPEEHLYLEILNDKNTFNNLLKENLIEKYKNKNLIIKSHQNFYSTFFKNESTKDIINKFCFDESDCIKEFFKSVKLKDYVIERLNKLNIPSNTIGIHIRACRKYVGREAVYLSKEGSLIFKKALDQIEPNKNRPILLSTDDLDDLNIFNDRNVFLPDSDYPHHCDFNRSFENDLKAFSDIYALGMCEKVIISFWSNFSRIAVLRNKTPFYIVPMIVNDDYQSQRFIHEKKIECKEKYSHYQYSSFNIDPIKEGDIYRIADHSEILSKHVNY